MSSFKTRLLIALILVVAVTWINQGHSRPAEMVQSWLDYTTTRDYDVGRWVEAIWNGEVLTPAVSTSALHLPCGFTGIVRHFGWYYNPRTGTQAFNPGVVLRIDADTTIYPVLRGEVVAVTALENGYQVVLQHGDAMTSIVRGLYSVSVTEGEAVETSTPLGKGTDLLYLELKNEDEPINPEGFLTLENPI